ncbi:MAG: hypothetical protein BWY91_02642 [bacterium ADurb.BinA028]|nr:MAG: hypothetical protein BWY91_02642 [bacterium ADurb.BinA028]
MSVWLWIQFISRPSLPSRPWPSGERNQPAQDRVYAAAAGTLMVTRVRAATPIDLAALRGRRRTSQAIANRMNTTRKTAPENFTPVASPRHTAAASRQRRNRPGVGSSRSISAAAAPATTKRVRKVSRMPVRPSTSEVPSTASRTPPNPPHHEDRVRWMAIAATSAAMSAPATAAEIRHVQGWLAPAVSPRAMSHLPRGGWTVKSPPEVKAPAKSPLTKTDCPSLANLRSMP